MCCFIKENHRVKRERIASVPVVWPPYGLLAKVPQHYQDLFIDKLLCTTVQANQERTIVVIYICVRQSTGCRANITFEDFLYCWFFINVMGFF